MTGVLASGKFRCKFSPLTKAEPHRPLLPARRVGFGDFQLLRQRKGTVAHAGQVHAHPLQLQPSHPIRLQINLQKHPALPVAVAIHPPQLAALVLQIFPHLRHHPLLISRDAAQLLRQPFQQLAQTLKLVGHHRAHPRHLAAHPLLRGKLLIAQVDLLCQLRPFAAPRRERIAKILLADAAVLPQQRR